MTTSLERLRMAINSVIASRGLHQTDQKFVDAIVALIREEIEAALAADQVGEPGT